jgi:glutamate racemase
VKQHVEKAVQKYEGEIKRMKQEKELAKERAALLEKELAKAKAQSQASTNFSSNGDKCDFSQLCQEFVQQHEGKGRNAEPKLANSKVIMAKSFFESFVSKQRQGSENRRAH